MVYGIMYGVERRGFYKICYFDCFEGDSKSVQVLLNGVEAVMALTLIVLK